MYKVIYSENSINDLRKIDKTIAARILKKIMFFSEQKDIKLYSKALKGFGENYFRFRIGDYRAIFKLDNFGNINVVLILNIKHRKDVYLK